MHFASIYGFVDLHVRIVNINGHHRHHQHHHHEYHYDDDTSQFYNVGWSKWHIFSKIIIKHTVTQCNAWLSPFGSVITITNRGSLPLCVNFPRYFSSDLSAQTCLLIPVRLWTWINIKANSENYSCCLLSIEPRRLPRILRICRSIYWQGRNYLWIHAWTWTSVFSFQQKKSFSFEFYFSASIQRQGRS